MAVIQLTSKIHEDLVNAAITFSLCATYMHGTYDGIYFGHRRPKARQKVAFDRHLATNFVKRLANDQIALILDMLNEYRAMPIAENDEELFARLDSFKGEYKARLAAQRAARAIKRQSAGDVIALFDLDTKNVAEASNDNPAMPLKAA